MSDDEHFDDPNEALSVLDPVRYERLYKHQLYRLLVKVTGFYIVVITLIVLLFRFWPSAIEYLPFGGVAELAADRIMQEAALREAVQTFDLSPLETADEKSREDLMAHPKNWFMDAVRLFIAMATTWFLMLPVAWTYRTIHRGHDYDHSIDETSLMLPAIVAAIVAIVQYSLAIAFSLAGIVAGVRFRRALNDTFDTLFIFVAIAVGLAAGVGSIEIAVAATLFFTYATVLMCLMGDGLQSSYDARKKAIKKNEKKKKNRQVITDLNDYFDGR